ncbi:MAG: hypothetical protein WBM83_14875, partial [Flavobacteriaceae bacterium]
YSVSPTRVRKEVERPDIPLTLVYGENDESRPSVDWSKKVGVDMEIINNFGHALYSDEKIIQKVCLDLLATVTHKIDKKKAV